MKITKRQLKQVIREEKQRLLAEQGNEQHLYEAEQRLREALDEFIMVYDEYLGYDVEMHTIRRRIDDVVGEVVDMNQNYQGDQ